MSRPEEVVVLIGLIVACEVGFWVFLAAGLVARYGLHRPRVGAALLICVPLVDLVLLVATVVDLRHGAVASTAHGLAAVYLGFSVAFGHRTIASIDARVAHRFAGGPAPVAAPRRGPARVAHEWALWRRAALAWLVASGLLVAAIVAVGDAARTAALDGWLIRLTVVLAVWLLLGPAWARVRAASRQPTRWEPRSDQAPESVRASR